MDDLEKLIDDCIKFSVVDPKIKAKFQDIFGVKTIDEYIKLVASKNNISFEEGHNYNHEKLSKSDLHEIDDAREKFSDMIHKSWVNLRDTYESSMDDENVAETLRINDYKFDEYGDIV